MERARRILGHVIPGAIAPTCALQQQTTKALFFWNRWFVIEVGYASEFTVLAGATFRPKRWMLPARLPVAGLHAQTYFCPQWPNGCVNQ